MLKRYISIILLSLIIIFGCEQFENQRVIVVNSDEVSTVTVRCYKVLGVPSMCAYVDETTRTVRIEDVVTRIIERIVTQKVITEVPVEKIVTQIETRYIDNNKEVDIEEIVISIIERIKKYVQTGDIIDVPIKDIVDETTDFISDAPRPENDTDVPFISTPIGDIKSEDDTKTDDVSTPKDDDTLNGETPNGNNTPNGDTTDGNNTPKSETPNGNNTPNGDTTDGNNTPKSETPNGNNTPNGDTTDGNNTPNGDTTNGNNTPNGDTTDGNNTPNDDTTNGNNTPNGEITDGNNTPNDDTTNGDTTNGDNTPNEDGTDPNTPPKIIEDGDKDIYDVVFDGNTVKLQVTVGPRIMAFQPILNQPGVFIDIQCNIDGNIVHPRKDSFSVFRGDKWNLWGLSVWCEVPSELDDSDTTISIKVDDFKRWCGLTTSDIVVSKYFPTSPTTSTGGEVVDAVIKLSPELIPLCNNLPVFTEGKSTIRYVLEHTPSNVAIGLPVTATDDDGETLEYTLGGTDASSFSIDSSSGQIRTKDPIDYETKNSYSVLVSVSDDKDGTDEIAVTINVTDDNEAPEFTEGESTTRSIAENTLANSSIGDPVSATDENDDTLEYALVGTDASSFGIDSSSGQLKTSAPLNYEDTDSYSVSIVVSDNKGGTDEIAVTINVTDENDAPIFTEGASTSRSVAENLPSGAVVGTPVLATDEDGDTPEYDLEGTDAASFNINASSGQITTTAILDHEVKSTYSVEVTVTDNNGGTDEIAVTINVSDVNDEPIFTEGTGTNRSVAENLSPGTVVGDPVEATDEDEDTLEYDLMGTDADSFNINDSSGQITTKAKFNYEVKDSYSVSVTVTDNNGGTDEIAVSISVSDENDKPIFTDGFFSSRSVAENLAIGTLVGDPVEATDEDDDTLEYSLAGTDVEFFSIDMNTGQITTNEIFNHEEKSSYSVTVSVSDGRGGKNGTFLTVSITDVNDAPVFTEGEKALRAIIESAASGSNVGHAVSATDEDEDTLAYSISGTDASSFSFNTSNGQLTTNSTLDYDIQSSYTVTVSVTDNNGGTDTITVEIEVLEFYVEKEEFFEVYYAIKLDSDHLQVQVYAIRGYGYDGEDPIYVDNYYKFEDGDSEQTSTGWSSVLEELSVSNSLDSWKGVYTEESGFTHANTKVSLKNTTADEVRKAIYKTICNAVHNTGTWSTSEQGVTYPEIDDNTSDDILGIATIISYLEDDDCDPTN